MDKIFLSDSGSLKKTQKMADGTLRLSIAVSKVGPLHYPAEDGSEVILHVVPHELFKPSSLETLRLQSLTISHPSPPLAQNLKRRKALEVGKTGEVIEKDSPLLIVSSVISDDSALSLVEKARVDKRSVEVSASYTCVVVNKKEYLQKLEDSGGSRVFTYADGTVFNLDSLEDEDLIQTDRAYDHIAILKEEEMGRAGPDVKLLLDSLKRGAIDLGDNRMKEEQKKLEDSKVSNQTAPESLPTKEYNIVKVSGIEVLADYAEAAMEMASKAKTSTQNEILLGEALAKVAELQKLVEEDAMKIADYQNSMDEVGECIDAEMEAVASDEYAVECEVLSTEEGAESDVADEAKCDSVKKRVSSVFAALHSKIAAQKAQILQYEAVQREAKMDSMTEVLKEQISLSSSIDPEKASVMIEQATKEGRSERLINELIISAAGGDTMLSDSTDAQVSAVAKMISSLRTKEADVKVARKTGEYLNLVTDLADSSGSKVEKTSGVSALERARETMNQMGL